MSKSPRAPCRRPVIPPTVSKAFNPAVVNSGGTSTLTITLSNAHASPATGASFVDTLPAGVTVSDGPQSNSCGGTLSASNGSTTVTLTGGMIPGNGSCTVAVTVTSTTGGLHTNTLGVGALQTSNGSNAAAADRDLERPCAELLPPTLVKAFSPATITAGGISTLTITLSNTNARPPG